MPSRTWFPLSTISSIALTRALLATASRAHVRASGQGVRACPARQDAPDPSLHAIVTVSCPIRNCTTNRVVTGPASGSYQAARRFEDERRAAGNLPVLPLSQGRLLRRSLVAVGLGLALALAPGLAGANSCGGFERPSVERCRTAARVFAGTVEAVEVPFLFEPYDSNSVVRLRVDTVWRGDPPSALLAYAGGPFGNGLPAPRWPFLICDDHDDTWTVVSMCNAPLFGEVPEIRASLGPGRSPTAPPALEWQSWRTRELLEALAMILVFPLAAIVLGAGVGWLVRRHAARPARGGVPIRRVLVLAAALVVARLIAKSVLSEDMRSWYVGLVVVGLATLVGLGLGYRGQRAPAGALRGLAVAVLGTGLMLLAGFVRLHFPVQPRDAVACSEARAREFLRTAPIDFEFDRDDPDYDYMYPSPAATAYYEEALRIAEETLPRACTDWGLFRMRFDRHGYRGPCVEFDDALGGSYRMCARESYARFEEESPG